MPLSLAPVLAKSSASSLHLSNCTKDAAVLWHLAVTRIFLTLQGPCFFGQGKSENDFCFPALLGNPEMTRAPRVARKTLHSPHSTGFLMGPFAFGIKKTDRHGLMSTLAKKRVNEPLFHGILLAGSGFDLCANFQERQLTDATNQLGC